MKRFLTSVSLQQEPKASDVITFVKTTFFRTSIVRNFISRGVKMRISAHEACVKPYLRTRSAIKYVLTLTQACTVMSVRFFLILLTTFMSGRYRISQYKFILDFMVCTALTVIIKDSSEILMKHFWT